MPRNNNRRSSRQQPTQERKNNNSRRRSSNSKREEENNKIYADDASSLSSEDSTNDDDEAAMKEELNRKVVEIAVKAGLALFGGFSLCFSTLFIPGLIPFLGGIFCGVTLLDPPPLDKLLKGTNSTNNTGDDRRRRSSSSKRENDKVRRGSTNDANRVLKSALKTLFAQFF
mmetsp:Transcript_4695/g.6802  ORF Transcript_4695/g.6802 Transcript_4695/m.6802 type:complete len:171 (+) Transcript_4695:149-661(+)|eukprot:CAMPEP_0194215826 /NCGR_PEP_ID=MMETSP0156-20130528/17885_1 /TAXON_ID=33649 /ORGANISM="Thalassionema nitzschioides, Strain L26-B" /LENGTH=170 /DNA_ID=CAMNT_0038944449 /DNA_START=42 /DNA_END=554 /DNA_ORIENTATION=+